MKALTIGKKFLFSVPFKISPNLHFYLFTLLTKLYLLSLLNDPVINKAKELIKKGDTIIDVGANRGTYSYLFSFLNKNGSKVFAFEPQETVFTILKKNIGCKVNIHKCGLSSRHGDSIFYEHLEGSGPSSSLEKFSDLEKAKKVLSYQVRVTTLDMFCKEYSLSPSFLKIDTEGHDLEVIYGAKNIIKANKPIIIFEFIPHLTATNNSVKAIKLLNENYSMTILETGLKFESNRPDTVIRQKDQIIGQENQNILCLPLSSKSL